MSRCRPCISQRRKTPPSDEAAHRERLLLRIGWWAPLLTTAELGAVAALVQMLGRAAEQMPGAPKLCADCKEAPAAEGGDYCHVCSEGRALWQSEHGEASEHKPLTRDVCKPPPPGWRPDLRYVPRHEPKTAQPVRMLSPSEYDGSTGAEFVAAATETLGGGLVLTEEQLTEMGCPPAAGPLLPCGRLLLRDCSAGSDSCPGWCEPADEVFPF
jgi:hypothetical protein